MHTTDPNSTSRRHRACPRWRRLVLLAVACAGCKSSPRYDLIEAELRTRERELAAAKSELRNSRQLNEAYQRQTRPPTVEAGGPVFQPLKEIVLGSGTGGVDNDNRPGDEALQVVVVPRDEDNSAVKVPAAVTVLAFEVSRAGTKTPIGRWDATPEQLHRYWRGGLFSTGYYLLLQWDQLPTTERVRLVVQLRTLDGRLFETDKDVTVRVLPGAGVGTPGPAVVVPPAVLPATPAPALPDGIPPPSVPTAPPRLDELPPPTEVRSRPVQLAPARPGDR